MHRLYLQIYLAVVAVLLIFAVLIATVFWRFDQDRGPDRWLAQVTTFVEAVLPAADAPVEDARRVAEAVAKPLDLDLSIFAPDGELLVQVGAPLRPPPQGSKSGWTPTVRGHRSLAIETRDGRWVVIDDERDHRPITHLFAAIGLLGLATGVAAFPLARRLTRRLEALKGHVEALGEGHLGERVPVEGRDEIAQLAGAFNRTADRIEALVSDKTRLLANTSHELRTPLTRVRMALELIRENLRPELLERVDRDIEELDELIGELLVSSRLDAPERRLDREPVDLLAMAAEEAARLDGVSVAGAGGLVEGDPRLLRRLVRNLIENALRHGLPPVEVDVSPHANGDERSVRLIVADRGPGVPETERERIFEPFYRPAGQASAEGGIGLGLALVRQIAERHDGRVLCEARAGGGTRFVLELPAG